MMNKKALAGGKSRWRWSPVGFSLTLSCGEPPRKVMKALGKCQHEVANRQKWLMVADNHVMYCHRLLCRLSDWRAGQLERLRQAAPGNCGGERLREEKGQAPDGQPFCRFRSSRESMIGGVGKCYLCGGAGNFQRSCPIIQKG